ncbi:MAG: glycosyltransferase family 9 protein [Bacteroidetes bacterium]|nr:glycosyltransferase family 9 protein [Bacteroidota bacterium]
MADAVLKILVSRLKFIGDIVLTTPVIHVLREKFPDAEIHYLGDKHGVTLLEKNPALDRIIPYDFGAPSVLEQLRTSSMLRKERYDVAIDLFGNPRSAIIIYLSGAKMRIGGNFGWRGKTYTHPMIIRERLTAVAFHLRYLHPLGVEESYRRPKIYLDDAEIAEAGSDLASFGIEAQKPVVGLHIGATWPAKVWPAKNFARVADLATEWLGAQVVVTHGPRDGDYFAEFVSAAHGKYFDFSPHKLRKLAAVISCCDVYVSNDAAPMHISAAVGTPTVGIFGPGEPDIWFPYQKELGHVALKRSVDCCHKDFCDLKGDDHMRCMKLIRPEDVYETVEQILKNNKRVN